MGMKTWLFLLNRRHSDAGSARTRATSRRISPLLAVSHKRKILDYIQRGGVLRYEVWFWGQTFLTDATQYLWIRDMLCDVVG